MLKQTQTTEAKIKQTNKIPQFTTRIPGDRVWETVFTCTFPQSHLKEGSFKFLKEFQEEKAELKHHELQSQKKAVCREMQTALKGVCQKPED